MPRSPVWLRKIPSTVSGSQGSRRGLRPAVRFAFPLGARLNTTLRARPCQELFSESFSRPSRGPRGAPPSGLRPFAAASSVLYAPPAPRGRETRPHTGCRQLQRGGAEGSQAEGGVGLALRLAPRPQRFAPAHRRDRPGGPALARLGPPGRSIRLHAFNHLYISRRIGAHLQARSPPAFIAQAELPLSLALPHSPSPNSSRSEYQPWLLSTAKGTPKSSVMQSPVRSSSFLPSA